MPETTPADRVAAITRPNGKPYRPRRITANAVSDDLGLLAGVIVLGTHDVAIAAPLADEYARWQLGEEYRAACPVPGWYRDGYEGGERRWIDDGEHGRAGVWFSEIVEVSR